MIHETKKKQKSKKPCLLTYLLANVPSISEFLFFYIFISWALFWLNSFGRSLAQLLDCFPPPRPPLFSWSFVTMRGKGKWTNTTTHTFHL